MPVESVAVRYEMRAYVYLPSNYRSCSISRWGILGLDSLKVWKPVRTQEGYHFLLWKGEVCRVTRFDTHWEVVGVGGRWMDYSSWSQINYFWWLIVIILNQSIIFILFRDFTLQIVSTSDKSEFFRILSLRRSCLCLCSSNWNFIALCIAPVWNRCPNLILNANWHPMLLWGGMLISLYNFDWTFPRFFSDYHLFFVITNKLFARLKVRLKQL